MGQGRAAAQADPQKEQTHLAGCSEADASLSVVKVREVGPDVRAVCLGGPATQELDGVVGHALAGSQGGRTDPERMC